VNIDTKRELRAILKILVIGVSAISVIGLFEYLAGPEAILRWFSVNPLAGFIMEPESLKHKLSTGEFNWLIWTGTRCGLRVFGTFECVIVFSAYLGLSIPFFPWIKSYWFAGKYGLAKTVAMFFTIFLTLILTFSRSGYLSFIVMGIVFGVLLIKKIRFGKVAVVVALTTALVGGVIYMRGSVRDTLNTRFNKPVEEQFDRKPLWRNGIRIFLAKPLFGVGLANYDEGLAKYAGKEALILPAHNNYIQVAAEMGLIGVLAYLSVLLSCIWYSFKIFVHASDNEIKFLALGFVGMWCWYCTQSMFNTYLFADKYSMMFWLMAGLNAVLYRIFRNETIGNPGNLTL
jgi:putative inorganic carbon (HCO3(-)) transporter